MSTLASSVRHFLNTEVAPYIRHRNKKPLHLQLSEMYRLWRYWRYVPYQYVKYELYAKDFTGDLLAFMPPMLIKKIQDRNSGPQLDIVRDKRRFEAHMSAHGLRCIAPSWLVIEGGGLRDADDEPVSFDAFRKAVAARAGDLFAKPVRGSFGRDARVVHAGDLTPDILAGMPDTLIQPRVRQHPALTGLFPHALNTIRLDSFIDGDRVHHTGAALRIGTGTMNYDNWAQGGIIVGIDMQTGSLKGRGYRKPKFADCPFYDRHPDTGVAFEGY